MAKKDPTDLTVEEKLKTLYQLQAALSSIDEKRALRGELPLEVQDLEDEIEGLTTRVEKIKAERQRLPTSSALSPRRRVRSLRLRPAWPVIRTS